METKNIRDPEIRKILQKVEKNIATHLDGQQYAIRVGQNTADVIITNLLDGLEIPEYYKLEATIMPLLKNDHQLINELAARIQENLYEKANLGLNPIRPALEADRAEDLINAISDAENITKARNLVDSSLVDLVQHFDDKFIEDNARQEYRSGLRPKIRRMIAGGACRWCKALAGSYNYPDAPADVYRRHQNCRCIVTYDPGDGRRQNVHSKKWTPEEEFEQAERALDENFDISQSGGRGQHRNETNPKWQVNHAELYWEEVKNRKAFSDAKKITRNVSGFSEDEIEQIRRHVFIEPHLRNGGFEPFDPDYEEAQAWQRLVDGKNIRASDLMLLEHERYESNYMRSHPGCTYEEAHAETDKIFNWSAMLSKEER